MKCEPVDLEKKIKINLKKKGHRPTPHGSGRAELGRPIQRARGRPKLAEGVRPPWDVGSGADRRPGAVSYLAPRPPGRKP